MSNKEGDDEVTVVKLDEQKNRNVNRCTENIESKNVIGPKIA